MVNPKPTKRRRRSLSDTDKSTLCVFPSWEEATGKNACSEIYDSLAYSSGRLTGLRAMENLLKSESFGVAGAKAAKDNFMGCLVAAFKLSWVNSDRVPYQAYKPRDANYKEEVSTLQRLVEHAHTERNMFEMQDLLMLLRIMKGRWDEGPVRSIDRGNPETILLDLYIIAMRLPGKFSQDQLRELFDLTWGEFLKIEEDHKRPMYNRRTNIEGSRSQLADLMMCATGLGGKSETFNRRFDFARRIVRDGQSVVTVRNEHTVSVMEAMMKEGPVWEDATGHVKRKCPCCGESTPNEFKLVTQDQIGRTTKQSKFTLAMG